MISLRQTTLGLLLKIMSTSSSTPISHVVFESPSLSVDMLSQNSYPSSFGNLNQSPNDSDSLAVISSQNDIFSPDLSVIHPIFTTGILREIFKNFEPVFSTRYPNFPLASHDLHDCRCLLGAALTCKTFLDPALDSLWFYLDSMLPLLRLFPSLKLMNGKYVVHGNIQVEDVERVSRYARRVKILLFRASEIRPTQHLYLQLSQLVPAPLFPSLRRLESPTAQKVSDVMEGILIALSPALRVLTFNSLTVAEDALVGAFISSLAVKTTSNLTHLVLYGHVSTDTLLHVFEFENLQSLELALLQDVAANVFTLLDKFENLSNLTIDVQRCSVIPSRVAPPTSPRRSRHSFPPSPTLKSLKKLHVSGKPVDIVLVLSGTRPSHLQYFSVECYHDTSYVGCSPTMMRCLEGYVFRSHPSLCTFNFMHHPPLTSKCHFSLTDLPNITSLHSLENFSLETSLFSADIGKLEEFVSAWPNLKILILPLFWSDAVPTLTFLATLRTFCPRLQEVHLPLIPEIPTLLPANISAYHPLKKLSVTPIEFDQEATFENQLRVSQFITQLFPDAAVDLRRTSNSTSTGFWEKVQATVKLCQEVRKRTISFTVNRHKVIAR